MPRFIGKAAGCYGSTGLLIVRYIKYFSKILTISENDSVNFARLVDPEKILVVGDTKFDQVIFRRDESQKMKIIPPGILKDRWVFIAGSTWPEDHVHLIPAIQNLHKESLQFLSIICPHEPTLNHIAELKNHLHGLPHILLSDIQNYQAESIIIIDRIGLLANLYGLGKSAYVGGSFKQNIHNVLEAAVYQIPVIYGPVNQNSHEAQLLKASMGGWEVRNSEGIQNIIEKFISNDVFRLEAGLKAFSVVENNLGATSKTIQVIASFLKGNMKD